MTTRAFVAPVVLALAGAAGCAMTPIRVYPDPAGPAVFVAPPPVSVATADDEPVVCLFALRERRLSEYPGAFMAGGNFRSYRYLTAENPDPRGCGVLVSIRQTGASVYGTSYVEVYSARGGELVLKAQAEGHGGPWFGFQSVSRYLKAGLQAGAPLRAKLDSAGAAAPVDTGWVLRTAGQDLLTWDFLQRYRHGNDPESRRLAEMRAREVAAAARGARPEAAAAAPSAAPSASVAASDVDELPLARPTRKAYAVVVGVEHYREKLPAADYAAGDARLAAQYFQRVLGVPEENVALLVDDRATKGDFEKYFERWLPNRVEAGDTVYVYFSGHGAPNPAKGDAYLVPYDGDPTYIDQTGFAVKRLFDDLAKLPAKQVYVAMDSCFSGAGGRSVIAKGARPLVTVVQNDVPSKLTVLSASAGDQISNGYEKKGHGLFTYFLLKGLKEKGDLRAAFDYAQPEVARAARRDYNADQEPQWREGR